MINENELFNISAECLLNYLYPDKSELWKVNCAGTFYRNYNRDILDINDAEQQVTISRDSFLRLLPQGIIADDYALKGKNFDTKYRELKKREEILRDLFKPVDTLAFRFRLHTEQQTAELLQDKLKLMLKHFFNFNLEEEKNPYIIKTAPLLLLISHLRANYSFIRNLLELLFNCKVEIKTGRYTWEENPECTQPSIIYQLIIENLKNEDYNVLKEEIEPFKQFMSEWFIPFNTYFDINIRQHNHPFVLGNNLTLNYNLEFNNQQ